MVCRKCKFAGTKLVYTLITLKNEQCATAVIHAHWANDDPDFFVGTT